MTVRKIAIPSRRTLEVQTIPTATKPQAKSPGDLRSARWFGPADLRPFGHRSRAMQMGYVPEEWTDKPVIAIINTWPDLQPCHSHFK
jgi:dihydroxyacid dehydratase/phosphogluconate dehydratase